MLLSGLGRVHAMLVAGVLGFAMLFCTTAPARAETSAHRLKRKLHKVERKSGEGFDVAGDVGLVAAAITLDLAQIGVATILEVDLEDLEFLQFGREHRLLHQRGGRDEGNANTRSAPKGQALSKEHSK